MVSSLDWTIEVHSMKNITLVEKSIEICKWRETTNKTLDNHRFIQNVTINRRKIAEDTRDDEKKKSIKSAQWSKYLYNKPRIETNINITMRMDFWIHSIKKKKSKATWFKCTIFNNHHNRESSCCSFLDMYGAQLRLVIYIHGLIW